MKYGELTLGQIEAVVNKLGGMTGVMQLLSEEVAVVAKPSAPKLLSPFTYVKVPSVTRFAAADHFKHGEVVEGVQCYLGDNFREHFGTKVEENVDGCDIRVHTLLQDSRDLPIRAEIGEEREETKLAHLWSMLKLQSKGEQGALLTNGYANIFYIRDTENVLWAVNASWYGGGWCLDASSVERPYRWHDGDRVCSR